RPSPPRSHCSVACRSRISIGSARSPESGAKWKRDSIIVPPSGKPEELRHLLFEKVDLAASLTKIREEAQVLPLDDAAVDDPRMRAKEAIELDHLAVGDKDAVFADERLEDAPQLAQELFAEVRVAIAKLAAAVAPGAARHEEREVAVRLEEVGERGVPFCPG